MMDVLLQTYYILLPVVATALIGWVGVLLKDQKKKETDRDEAQKRKETEQGQVRCGIMLILRYLLKRYHAEYMIQDKITYNQYKDWMDLYSAYESLGGNSIAVDWNNDIEDMEKCDSTEEMSPFESMVLHGIKQ